MNQILKWVLLSLSVVCLCSTSTSAQNVTLTATSGTTSGSYASLTAAFTAINNGTHKGEISIRIDADYTASSTTGTASINASGSGSASYSSIYIYPNGSRVITATFNGPLITFNGADNVVINGINASGNTLTLKNDNTGAYGHVAIFQSGASNNTIRNCNLYASPVGYGVINFAASDYNDNDSISGCNIGPSPSGGYPQVAIYGYASGTLNYASDNVVIYNNNIYDFRHSTSNANSYGVLIGTSQNNWKIYNNRFYQTTTISFAQSNYNFPIYVNNTQGTVDIRNNIIGYSTSITTGTYTLYASSATAGCGMYAIYIVNASVGSSSNVQNNSIQSIYVKSYINGGTAFAGIVVSSGAVDIGNIAGNTIGSSSSTSSILIEAMYPGGNCRVDGINAGTSYVTSIQNNSIGGVTMKYMGSTSVANTMSFYGIIQNVGSAVTIYNNTIGSNTQANSITISPESGYASNINTVFVGIYCGNITSPSVISNMVANVYLSGSGTSGYCYPIYMANASGSANATFNTIKYISSTATTYTIYLYFCPTNEVSNNAINNVSTTGTYVGIYINLYNNTSPVSTTISNNIINNISNCTNFYGIYTYYCTNVYVSSNSIYSVTASGTMWGIYAHACVTSTISGNSINTLSPAATFNLIYTNSCSGQTTISSNTIAFVNATASSSSSSYCIQSYYCTASTISSNTISGITANSTYTGSSIPVSLTGIYLYTIYSGNIINGNTINGLHNSNTSTTHYVNGILLYAPTTTTTAGADIYQNNIKNVSSSSNSGTSTGIYMYGGTSNTHNNFVCINNSLSNNVYGVHCFYTYSGQTVNLYYNTVYIEGSNTRTGETVCLLRSYTNLNAQNNIFYNKRTSSGNNYAISNPNYSNYSNFTLNYNLLVVNDTAAICKLSSTIRGWYTYGTGNSTDKWSWADKAANITAASLFNDASNGDLTINTSSNGSWYANGKGVPISGYSVDWNNETRSTAVSTGATDLGADEFSTSTTPPAATHSGSLTAGSTSTYTFAGKTVAQITWQSGYSTPSTAPSVWYYTGKNPTAPISGTEYMNCYWEITASPSTGYGYILKLYYSDAELGTLSSNADLRIAKNHSGTTAGWACQCATSGAGSTTIDATNRTIANVTPYTSFSIFTGTDVSNPLPVELVSLDAEKTGEQVLVKWVTASEQNASHFFIERSYDGTNYTRAGRVEAAGNSNIMHTYNFIDRNADLNSNLIYYRLQQVDMDGSSIFTPFVLVKNASDNRIPVISVSPNPFTAQATVEINALQPETVTIEVVDMFGKPVFTTSVEVTKGQQEIPIPESGLWNKGTYLILIHSASMQHSQKLIKF